MSTVERWVRPDFRRAAHLSTGPRQVACGASMGYGMIETAPVYARRCQRCARIAATKAAKA